MMTLSALHVYPVKSAAGLSLQQATVEARGLEHDRRWMVVDAKGKFMTQRQHPRLALIRVSIDEQLRLEFPQQPPLTLPLVPSPATEIEVEVWGDRTLALSMGPEAAHWLSNSLETPCRLVYMPNHSHRPTDHGKFGPNTLVSFADAYPFLLISDASLADLNSRLAHPIPMNRFRPNLVVTGCDAYAEDTWSKIRVGNVVFRVEKACDRCSIPGVDQTTGIPRKEPLLTLSTYRRRRGKIQFGQNLVQENLGQLRVIDPVEILERR